jgi:dimethylaniline monooxygenase (N-oxide forming)
LFCPLTAEISALWLAAYLTGGLHALLPSEEERRRQAEDEARWLDKRTNGCHAKGTSIVPFSMSFVDELLKDLGVGIGWWGYLKEWILPVDPAACERIISLWERD